ncbi:MAG: hypothetical protein NVS9B7_29950 [Flavisolibacter sp.]
MKSTFLTLLAGIAIGILLAPTKGSETWKRLVDGFNDYKDKATGEANDLYEKGKDAVKRGKAQLEGVTHQG